MTYELTNEQKTDIVNQHLRSLEYSIYNIQLSVIEEESRTTPEESMLQSLNASLTDLNAKKTALLNELASINI
jgi:hypothetical protein